MPVTQDQLDEYAFVHTHSFTIEDGIPSFAPTRRRVPKKACVYMWISPSQVRDGHFDVMYVGKAGYGIERRNGQHRGGFGQQAGTGRANAELIRELLEGGRTLQVHARISGSLAIFGKRVSLYATEEAAACEAFEPQWNRAAFPRVEIAAQAPAQAGAPAPAAEVNAPAAVPLAGLFNDVLRGDEADAFVQSLDQESQHLFLRILGFLRQREPEIHKVAGGYTDQPHGYDNVPMLVVGPVRRTDGRAVHWYARVPLTKPLTIIFNPERVAAADQRRVSQGPSGTWCPLDIHAFLDNPGAYITP